MKEQIRPIYSQLQGYLEQAPQRDKSANWTKNLNMSGQVNNAIDELNTISSKSYDGFKIQPKRMGNGAPIMEFDTYRTNLGGLIARLHAEYFSDEDPPFRGMPTTVITQSQSQDQSQSVSFILDLHERVISELPQHKEGSKEKGFLEKLKSALPSIKTGTDILAKALEIGSNSGLSVEAIRKTLGL